MLKLYRSPNSGYTGQDVESWDRTWETSSIERAVQWAAICHLRPIFDRYFPRTGKILEGGCGLGQFVIYYRSLGYDIEGVDFSPRAIARLKAYDRTLPVRLADVTRLPHGDGSIKCYFSGGVIEHLEEGPEAALAEARRVLAPDGHLLITVPYANWIRRAQSRLGVRRRRWDTERVILLPRRQFVIEPPPTPEFRFAEYVFLKAEFARILEASGFAVEAALACDLEWGEVCQFVYRRLRRTQGRPAPEGSLASGNNGAGGFRAYARQLWKDLFVLEQPRQPWLRPLTRLLADLSGHMALFVAKPDRCGLS